MKTIKVRAKIKEPKEKFNFWKAVWLIVRNKKQTDGSLTSGLFGGIISMFFNVIAILGTLVFFCGLIGIIITVINLKWSFENLLSYIPAIIFAVLILFIILVFSFLFRAAANEMQIEEDRNYIISVFSSIVSFASLVVALVALLKGVAV